MPVDQGRHLIELRRRTKIFDKPWVGVDITGHYIRFEDNDQGRLSLTRCQDALEGKDLFPGHAAGCIVHFDTYRSSDKALNEPKARSSHTGSTDASMLFSHVSSQQANESVVDTIVPSNNMNNDEDSFPADLSLNDVVKDSQIPTEDISQTVIQPAIRTWGARPREGTGLSSDGEARLAMIDTALAESSGTLSQTGLWWMIIHVTGITDRTAAWDESQDAVLQALQEHLPHLQS